MNQADRTCLYGRQLAHLAILEDFPDSQLIASLQLRNLGRAGVEEDVAVWWPLTLRISSERYVARPERSGESAASPKLFEVYQNPRRWGSGKCCQFSIGDATLPPP